MKTYKGNNLSVKTAIDYSTSYYNAPMALFGFGQQLAIVGCGTSDDIILFVEPGFIYVYSANDGLEYMSVQVFNTETKSFDDDGLFFDYDSFRELEHLQPINRVKSMLQWY
jgi:hypothetical protein